MLGKPLFYVADLINGTLHIEYLDLRVVSELTVAVAFGLQEIIGTVANGSQRATWVRFTQGFRHVHCRWHAVHDHASVPADPLTGKALNNLFPETGGSPSCRKRVRPMEMQVAEPSMGRLTKELISATGEKRTVR